MLWSLNHRLIAAQEGASHYYLGACGDITVRIGERNSELWHDKGEVFQLGVFVEQDGSWFGLLGPPTAMEPVLDPDLAYESRRKHLVALAHRVRQAPGLSAMERNDVVCVFFRWDARREELSVRRDLFGRIPLVFSSHEDNRPKYNTTISTRPGYLSQSRITSYDSRADNNLLINLVVMGKDHTPREDFLPGVQRIFPGEEIRWHGAGWTSVYRAWNPENAPEGTASKMGTPANDSQSAEHIAQLLRRSLSRSEKEPSLTFTLSGGTDASSLVALATERTRRVHTASMVSSRHSDFDESSAINALVGRWRTEHFNVDIGSPDLWTLTGADPGWHDWGPQLVWETAYMRHFFAAVRADAARDQRTLVLGFGADQLLISPAQLYIEEIASHASAAELLQLMRVAIKGLKPREVARILTARMGVMSMIRHLRGPLIDRRLLLLEGWKWEVSMRTLERHRRASGLRFALPYLDADLWRFALHLTHQQRRTLTLPKSPLRTLLTGRAPDAIINAPKSGTFDQIVAHGMQQLFGTNAPARQTFESVRSSPFVPPSRFEQARRWLDSGSPYQDYASAAAARFVCSLAWWLEHLMDYDTGLTSPTP